MKQIFFDKDKLAVIKIFPTPFLMEREIAGAKSIKNFALVPKIRKLDSRVAAISLIDGFLGYQILEQDLNQLVARFLVSLKPVSRPLKFSIFSEIQALRKILKDQESQYLLNKIEKRLTNAKLYPVHGDLQKQNIIVSGGQLGLIDFEHFILAPIELELCNSLFFDDGNCLDIPEIIRFLPKNTINIPLLKLMLKFYSLKQISLGMSTKESKDRIQNALTKIKKMQANYQKIPEVGLESSLCYL